MTISELTIVNKSLYPLKDSSGKVFPKCKHQIYFPAFKQTLVGITMITAKRRVLSPELGDLQLRLSEEDLQVPEGRPRGRVSVPAGKHHLTVKV